MEKAASRWHGNRRRVMGAAIANCNDDDDDDDENNCGNIIWVC